MDLMLVHARATSGGNGHARNNSNNHPFVSKDKRVGMVHNGTLSEFQFLKDKYEILSNTDSEVLLRMFEEGVGDNEYDIDARIKGIEKIWSVIDDGAMSVGIGERIDAEIRYLYLFRNFKRPLWIADLRKLLGQIFFFSSPEIWYQAVASSNTLQKMIAGVPDLIEIPTKQIWCLWLDCEHPMLLEKEQVEKYDLTTKDSGQTWQAGDKIGVPDPKTSLSVMSQLDEKENVLDEDTTEWEIDTAPVSPPDVPEPPTKGWDETYEGLSVIEPPQNATDHEEILLQIGNFATDIETKASNLLMQCTLSAAEYQELIESLEQTKNDLEGTLRLLGE